MKVATEIRKAPHRSDNARSAYDVAAIILAILMLAFYVSVWTAHDPHGADFGAFYSGALLWERGQSVYDQKLICEIQAPLSGKLCMPFFHPPVLLPLLSLISNENYTQSYQRWIIVLIVVFVLCAVAVNQLTGSVAAAMASAAFLPNLFNFLHGQDSLFVLLGLLLCAWFLRQGQDAYAGIALSFTVLRPTLAIALGIPLLFVNRKVFLSFFISGLVLTLYSLVLVGPEGFRDLIGSLSTTHSDPTTRPDRMYSIVGALVWLRLSPALAWILFAASVPLIAWLWKKQGLKSETFGLAILISCFASPHLHLHDLSFLIIPLLVLPPILTLAVSLGFVLCMQIESEQLFTYGVMVGLALSLLRRGLLMDLH